MSTYAERVAAAKRGAAAAKANRDAEIRRGMERAKAESAAIEAEIKRRKAAVEGPPDSSIA